MMGTGSVAVLRLLCAAMGNAEGYRKDMARVEPYGLKVEYLLE